MTAPDFVPPTTLRDLLRATPRLAPDQAERLLGGIARALAARGAPHGALAPERVLVGPGDRIALDPPRPGSGPAPSPTYLAPEQIDGRPPDARSDVYALGLIGWEMLAGQQPWEGDSLYGIVIKQREQDLPRLSTLRPGLPRALVQAVEGALHKAPGDRWQSPAELLQLLGPAGASVEPAVATPARATPIAAPATPAVAPAAAPSLVPPAATRTLSRAEPLDEEDDAPPARSARASRPAGAGSRRRWLTVTALGLAALAAAGGAIAVVQGRRDSGATRAWLDSVTATTGGAAGAPAAVSATTTTANTTSAPIRRTGGRREEPVDLETPDTSAPVDVPTDSTLAPALEPTPPFVPAAPGRPIRPTVPLPPARDTVQRPDTLDTPR